MEPLLSNFMHGRSICQQQTEAISTWLGDSCHNVNILTRLSQLLQPCTSAEVNNGALLSNFMHGRSICQQQTEAISSWLGESCHNVNILTRLSQLLQPCISAEQETEAISTWLGDSCHNVNILTRLSQLLQPCISAEVNNGALLSNFMHGRSICQQQTEAISTWLGDSCHNVNILTRLSQLLQPCTSAEVNNGALLSNFMHGRSICQQQTEAISTWLGDSCHNVNILTRLSQLLQPCISAEVNNGALLSNFMHGRSIYQQQTEAISSWLGDSCHNVNILTRLSQLLQPCTSAEVNNGALLSNFMHGRSIYQQQTEAISSWLGDSCHNVNILTRLSQLLQPCTSAEQQTEAISTWLGDSCHNVNILTRLSQLLQPCTSAEVNNGHFCLTYARAEYLSAADRSDKQLVASYSSLVYLQKLIMEPLLSNFMHGRSICQLQTEAISTWLGDSCHNVNILTRLSQLLQPCTSAEQETEAISTWLGDSCHNVNILTRLSQLLQPCISAEVNNGALLSNFMHGRSICQQQTEAISTWLGDSCHNVNILTRLSQLLQPCTSAEVNNGALLSNFMHGRSICQQQTEAISTWLGDSCHNVNNLTRLCQLLQPYISAGVNSGANSV
ncbi:hypothetical protein J6590_077929 [Homalodisca vitripennis]|nr:hypothetical protein J6590_077929 [Homalodisca vitripennis]